MNCLVFGQSRLYVITIVFYTCVWIPFIQIKHALMCMFGLDTFYLECLQFEDEHLLAVKFELLKEKCCTTNETGSARRRRAVDESCAVCLDEFQGEEVVSELSGCGHMFHSRCIKSWADRYRFTCPLCRSVFL
ncbi:hypothetical protein GIB67_025451 [Kingdonia uniflora]|uniref:RING-type domain-containing protein n=1 Tax=Kingdonia uniflora TaxID=39325 RepID=A0A7J7N196_9MAGN|nr:hypothetical protein GIB67_025451 [Kingdonia uniflora]